MLLGTAPFPGRGSPRDNNPRDHDRNRHYRRGVVPQSASRQTAQGHGLAPSRSHTDSFRLLNFGNGAPLEGAWFLGHAAGLPARLQRDGVDLHVLEQGVLSFPVNVYPLLEATDVLSLCRAVPLVAHRLPRLCRAGPPAPAPEDSQPPAAPSGRPADHRSRQTTSSSSSTTGSACSRSPAASVVRSRVRRAASERFPRPKEC